MPSHRVRPGQLAGGQRQQSRWFGLNHIRRGAPGMPPAFAEAELDCCERRHSQLDCSTRMALGQQGTDGPGGSRQLLPSQALGLG